MGRAGERIESQDTMKDVVEREMMYRYMDTNISEAEFGRVCDAEIARREAELPF